MDDADFHRCEPIPHEEAVRLLRARLTPGGWVTVTRSDGRCDEATIFGVEVGREILVEAGDCRGGESLWVSFIERRPDLSGWTARRYGFAAYARSTRRHLDVNSGIGPVVMILDYPDGLKSLDLRRWYRAIPTSDFGLEAQVLSPPAAAGPVRVVDFSLAGLRLASPALAGLRAGQEISLTLTWRPAGGGYALRLDVTGRITRLMSDRAETAEAGVAFNRPVEGTWLADAVALAGGPSRVTT